jgi:protein-tyrosine phosphatase
MFQIERAERARSIASRRLVYGLVPLISGCVYFAQHTAQGACASSLDSPIRNFCVVTSQVLWRGERPNKTDATWLVEHRVGTIVNLQEIQNDHDAFDAAAATPDLTLSIDYFHLPDFEPLHMINWSFLDTHVARFLAIVSEAPRPVYVHCMDGIDRTGVLIAAYRVLIEGSSREDAIAEMARFRSPWLRVDAKYVRSLQGDRRAEIMRKMAEWKSKLKTSARIVCMRGKCTYSTINGDESDRALHRAVISWLRPGRRTTLSGIRNNFHWRLEHEMDSPGLRSSRGRMRELSAGGQSIGSGCGSARRGQDAGSPRSRASRS